MEYPKFSRVEKSKVHLLSRLLVVHVFPSLLVHLYLVSLRLADQDKGASTFRGKRRPA
ncbi:hypothetical protein LY76DRAFT_588223 [Colletotrichum caudatum]|nr:hypothetical protein LY76DRAFT_588223 [Colletotrichum caudatum]